MKTILLSTTSLWNCGDDFIREGIMRLLSPALTTNVIWWNRGWGIHNSYANSLSENLKMSDYVIIAGTPQWMMLNEPLYKHCLQQGKPLAIIGVGTNPLMNQHHRKLLTAVAKSGLCELALARDSAACNTLQACGMRDADIMMDPAFFMPLADPISEQTFNILGWRDYSISTHDPRMWHAHPIRCLRQAQQACLAGVSRRAETDAYNAWALRTYRSMGGPKYVVVHDNREVASARKIFGRESVLYNTDYKRIRNLYGNCGSYVGSRLHGAIPALVHGASVHLVYKDSRIAAFTAGLDMLAKHAPMLQKRVRVTDISNFTPPPDLPEVKLAGRREVSIAVDHEIDRVRKLVSGTPHLSKLMNV
jgi:polysaccharide pyruvyl transferase WcaK-like protein